MLELDEIKKMHDKAFSAGQTTREQAANDLVFYYLTQWDDNLLGESQLQYRGEFNILRKAGRKVISDLKSNPVSIDFSPVDASREDGADLLDGLYRTDERNNRSVEAFESAQSEGVICGFGAWVLRPEYLSKRDGSSQQVIRRYPIPEANNTVFWDPNAKLTDKSDADYVSLIHQYSEDAFEKLAEDFDKEPVLSSFGSPEHSYVSP